jgi:8-oxo-dGTP diphosphatase
VHVVAGALIDGDKVLLAQRKANAHLGGLWEFPGGKVEPGEEPAAALARELDEELGITVVTAEPLHTHTHHYPDKSVLLDVWAVRAWRGEPAGREGQPTQWVQASELPNWPLPEADAPVVERLLQLVAC